MAEIEHLPWIAFMLSPEQRAGMFIDWCALHNFGKEGWPNGAHAQLAAHIRQAEEALRHQLAQSQAEVERLQKAAKDTLATFKLQGPGDSYLAAIGRAAVLLTTALAPHDAGGGALTLDTIEQLANQAFKAPPTPPGKVFSAPLVWKRHVLCLGNLRLAPLHQWWQDGEPDGWTYVFQGTDSNKFRTRQEAMAAAEAAVLALAGAGE